MRTNRATTGNSYPRRAAAALGTVWWAHTCVVAASLRLPPVDVRRPPLGFNTWNHFHMHPTEAVILETAANFTSMGLRDAGYLFINTDDGWLSRNRSSVTGSLVPMPDQFPSGIPALTDKLHGMGFRFGIYGTHARVSTPAVAALARCSTSGATPRRLPGGAWITSSLTTVAR
jgi:hypothetical protein